MLVAAKRARDFAMDYVTLVYFNINIRVWHTYTRTVMTYRRRIDQTGSLI